MGSKLFAALEGAALAACISFAGCGCLVTGLGLALPLPRLGVVCALASLLFSFGFAFRWRYCRVIALAALAAALWQWKSLAMGVAAILDHVLDFCRRAYGWSVSLAGQDARGAAELLLGAAFLSTAVALAVSWAAAGRGWTVLAAAVAALPPAACMAVTDTVPAPPFLGAWLFGMALLLLTRLYRKAGHGAGLTAYLALPVGLAVALLFWAAPQEGYDKQGLPEELCRQLLGYLQTAGETAENMVQELANPAEDVDLSRVGNQIAFATPVMEVTAEQGGTLYLRGKAYREYDGVHWKPDTGDWNAGEFSQGAYQGQVQIQTRRREDVLYVPYNPGALSQFPQAARAGVENTDGLLEYALPRYSGGGTAEAMPDEAAYLALPEETRERAAAWLRAAGMEYAAPDRETAAQIVELVRRSAGYSLDTPRMPGEETDFALWFLEDSETGFCVHFASAAVVLLRAAGIPARYVTGYMLEAAAGETATVRARQAHAWAEAYLPGEGWVVLEATPAAGFPFTEETSATQAGTPPRQEAPSQPSRAPDAGSQSPAGRPENPQGVSNRPPQNMETAAGRLDWLWWMLGILGAAGAVAGQWRLRLFLRCRRFSQGDANAQALARWEEGERLARRTGQPMGAALLAVAEKAKYSQHAVTQEELALLDDYLRESREALAKRPWKWIYRLLYAFW